MPAQRHSKSVNSGHARAPLLERRLARLAAILTGGRLRRLLLMLLLYPAWLASHLVPRRKDLWAFGTWDGRQFTDNSRHLFTRAARMPMSGIRPVWITRSPELARELRGLGLESHTVYTLSGLWICLRASVYVFTHTPDDIAAWLSGRARRVNLWHGIPLKKINYDNRFDSLRYPGSVFKRIKHWPDRFARLMRNHQLLAPSPMAAELLQSAFRQPAETILVSPYPRNQQLVAPDSEFPVLQHEKACIEAVRSLRAQGRKIILYMPTFRRGERAGTYAGALNSEKLESFLVKNDAHLLVKTHAMSSDEVDFDPAQYQRITHVRPDVDPYLLLPQTDLLITDYSSIFFDFLLLDRPILFYPFDLEQYQKGERELYFDYAEIVPGPIAWDFDEMCRQLAQLLQSGEDPFKEKRAELRARALANDSHADASELLLDHLLQRFGPAHHARQRAAES